MINIAITGHRYLDKKYIEQCKQKIHNELVILKQQDSKIILYSALADGADRLMVNEAIKLDIDFIAVLPMDIEEYKKDFDTESKKEFTKLLKLAKKIIITSMRENISKDSQYEKVGYFMSDNCDILFAIWNGKYNNLKGGTSEIVKYHKTKGKEMFHVKVKRDYN